MIKAKLSHTVDFDLSDSEAKDITIKYICARFDWDTSYRIQKDECNNEEFVFHKRIVHSSHAFETEDRIRKATEKDKMVYQFLQEIINNSK